MASDGSETWILPVLFCNLTGWPKGFSVSDAPFSLNKTPPETYENRSPVVFWAVWSARHCCYGLSVQTKTGKKSVLGGRSPSACRFSRWSSTGKNPCPKLDRHQRPARTLFWCVYLLFLDATNLKAVSTRTCTRIIESMGQKI